MTAIGARHLAVCALAAAACASDGPPRSEPSRVPRVAAVASADPGPPARPGRLRRRDVTATLSRGLGDFLTRVDVAPLLAGGKFRGWRIVKLREGDPMWNGVDLVAGDVVTSVNRRPIERPEQALVAFQSLAIDKELRVAYERSGATRELAMPIDDDAR